MDASDFLSAARPTPNSREDSSIARPAKRARKIVNCDPCRSSKLKCDKGRPCSSCVLRGTVSQCYQGQDAPASGGSCIDPAAEFARIKYSILLLESHFMRGYRRGALQSLNIPHLPSTADQRRPLHDLHSADTGVPGMYGSRQSQHGFYTGPTSVASHLDAPDVPRSRAPTVEPEFLDVFSSHDYDRDLIDLLPPFHVIDGLIDYYFEYCTWIYWMVNQSAFLSAWNRFKSGSFPDRLVLATVSFILSLALRYLPLGHELLSHLPGPSSSGDASYQELSVSYYEIGCMALTRHQNEAKMYTIELVEALLAKCHYFVLAAEPERTWDIRGKLVAIATAMGLHRDPDMGQFSRDAAERRRWAWWHIMFIDRGQSFMFGRPFSIASHHFNTKLPSHCDPDLDITGRLHIYHVAVFRLMFILGELMDDAVSLRPVSYESFRNKDRLLEQWITELPSELQIDDFRIAQGLASPVTSVRRLVVQSVIVRAAFHHIRLTIHRPFSRVGTSPIVSQSLEISVASAGKVISLISLTIPDAPVVDHNPSYSPIHGHMAWRPHHVFAAAMFFTFQLIKNPEQPAAKMFKSYLKKSLTILEYSPDSAPAQKSLTVLHALAPLYSDQYLALHPHDKEKEKAGVLNKVKTLAFPHQDPPLSLPCKTEGPLSPSPANATVGGGGNSSTMFDGRSSAQRDFFFGQPKSSGYASSSLIAPSYPMQTYSGSSEPTFPINPPPSYYSTMTMGSSSAPPSNLPMPSYIGGYNHHQSDSFYNSYQYQGNQFLPCDMANDDRAMVFLPNAYIPVADEWRGPVGFGQGEWMQFIGALESAEKHY